MKKLFLSLLLLTCSSAFAQYSFTVKPRHYWFSSEFDIVEKDARLFVVESQFFQLRKVYSLCDQTGEKLTGTAHLVSMGTLLNSMKQIDVEDGQGNPLGFIEGHWLTEASKKYFLYDGMGEHVATCYVGRDWNNVSVVDPNNERCQIAILRRDYAPGGSYSWETTLFNERAINRSLLYIFSTFIADTCQDSLLGWVNMRQLGV